MENLRLENWFEVTFDEAKIYRKVSPPTGLGYQDEFFWKDIIRICFKPTEEFFESDEIYIFTNTRPESYVIPSEAFGAAKLWGEIIDRKLFPADLAIRVASSTEGLYYWPMD
jgi:hypothetical protein